MSSNSNLQMKIHQVPLLDPCQRNHPPPRTQPPRQRWDQKNMVVIGLDNLSSAAYLRRAVDIVLDTIFNEETKPSTPIQT